MRHDINELLQDIEQERIKDKLVSLWYQWGNWFLAGIAAIIVGTAGWNVYQYSQLKQRTIIAERFEKGREALNNNQEAEGQKILEDVATRGVANYRAMARLALANFFMKNKRQDPAYAQFKALEKDKIVQPFYRGLGALSRMRLDYENKKDPKQLLAELDALIAQNQAVHLLALELKGFLLLQAQEYIKARDIFVEIAQAPQTDPQMRKRTHAMIRFITVKHF